MAMSFSYEIDGDWLRAKATGCDEGLDDVQRYGQAIIEAAIENGCTRILCDETELEYRLNVVDTLKLVQRYEDAVPRFLHTRVAVVPRPEEVAAAGFFEDAAQNRGLIFRVFSDRASAEAWLKS